jgi:hypothetical protein
MAMGEWDGLSDVEIAKKCYSSSWLAYSEECLLCSMNDICQGLREAEDGDG